MIARATGQQKLSPAAHKVVKEAVQVLTAKVTKLIRTSERKAKAAEDATKIHSGQLPPGMKPYKPIVEVPELDEPLPPELKTISCEIAAGASIRDARAKVHYLKIWFDKKTDELIFAKQMEKLRVEVTKDHFLQKCTAPALQTSSNVRSLRESLGLSADDDVFSAPTSFTAEKATQLYKAVFEKAAANAQKEKEKAIAKEENKKKQIELLTKSSPEELLQRTIAKEIEKKAPFVKKNERLQKNERSIDWTKAYVHRFNSNLKAEDCLENEAAASSSPPKNKATQKPKNSQAGGQDHDRSAGKAKGKGKGSTGKGKAAGKGQQAKGKGKGKGKTGQNPNDAQKGQKGQKGKKGGNSEGKGGKKSKGSGWRTSS